MKIASNNINGYVGNLSSAGFAAGSSAFKISFSERVSDIEQGVKKQPLMMNPHILNIMCNTENTLTDCYEYEGMTDDEKMTAIVKKYADNGITYKEAFMMIDEMRNEGVIDGDTYDSLYFDLRRSEIKNFRNEYTTVDFNMLLSESYEVLEKGYLKTDASKLNLKDMALKSFTENYILADYWEKIKHKEIEMDMLGSDFEYEQQRASLRIPVYEKILDILENGEIL